MMNTNWNVQVFKFENVCFPRVIELMYIHNLHNTVTTEWVTGCYKIGDAVADP